VIDGPQGIGKSRFVRYLGSPLPQFFMESGINTEDKDFLLYLASSWVWEVAELGSTMRKADRDALKHFLSRQTVRVRRAYGREYTDKPAVAAFIPTINNEAGFLWDPTGYRRYMVASVESFDWKYETAVEVNQVWAEAVAAYKAGEAWELSGEEAVEAEAASREYEIDDPLVDHILAHFEVDKDKARSRDASWFVPTAEVLHVLKTAGHVPAADRRTAMQVGGILLKLGCRRGDLRRPDGSRPRGHFGLWKRTP
jgi:predicted P-loop ATPase